MCSFKPLFTKQSMWLRVPLSVSYTSRHRAKPASFQLLHHGHSQWQHCLKPILNQTSSFLQLDALAVHSAMAAAAAARRASRQARGDAGQAQQLALAALGALLSSVVAPAACRPAYLPQARPTSPSPVRIEQPMRNVEPAPAASRTLLAPVPSIAMTVSRTFVS